MDLEKIKVLLKFGKNKNMFQKVFEILSCSYVDPYQKFGEVITSLVGNAYTQKLALDIIRGDKGMKDLTKLELLSIYKVLYTEFYKEISAFCKNKNLSMNQLKDWFMR